MNRRTVLFLSLVALAVMTTAGPTGRIAVQTHDLTDPSPRRVEATLALGKAALSVLITWTSRIR